MSLDVSDLAPLKDSVPLKSLLIWNHHMLSNQLNHQSEKTVLAPCIECQLKSVTMLCCNLRQQSLLH